MKTEKLSLDSIKNVLTRAELKKVMAGSGTGGGGGGGGCSCIAGNCGPGTNQLCCQCAGGHLVAACCQSCASFCLQLYQTSGGVSVACATCGYPFV